MSLPFDDNERTGNHPNNLRINWRLAPLYLQYGRFEVGDTSAKIFYSFSFVVGFLLLFINFSLMTSKS